MKEIILQYLPAIVSTFATTIMAVIVKGLTAKIKENVFNSTRKSYEDIKELKNQQVALNENLVSIQNQINDLTSKLEEVQNSNKANILLGKTSNELYENISVSFKNLSNDLKTIKKQYTDNLRKKKGE